ncbi:MAG: hypothetical protein R3B48_06660 [Kofleriaceae bacterium]
MSRTGKGLLWSWIISLALAGCGGAPRPSEVLLDSVRTYHEGLRWQRFSAAAARLPPAERSAFVDEWDERSSDLKITDYEIVDVALAGDAASVQVKISWYGESEGTLRDTLARQAWRRRGAVWVLTDEVRVRGAEMPGLAEPPEPTELVGELRDEGLDAPAAPAPGTRNARR